VSSLTVAGTRTWNLNFSLFGFAQSAYMQIFATIFATEGLFLEYF